MPNEWGDEAEDALPTGGGVAVEEPTLFPSANESQPSAVVNEFGDTAVVDEAPADPQHTGPRARLTFYHNFEDKYGSASAVANPLTGKSQSIPGVTIAVDPEVIPYGTAVRIPSLASYSAKGDGVFIAHDTGGDVKSRKASGGREPVIDVYVQGGSKEGADRLRDHLANLNSERTGGTGVTDFEILGTVNPQHPQGMNPSDYPAFEAERAAHPDLYETPGAITPPPSIPEGFKRARGGGIEALPRNEFGDLEAQTNEFGDPVYQPMGMGESLSNAIQRGKFQADLADEMRRPEGPRPDRVTAIQKLMQDYPASDAFQQAMNAQDSKGFFQGFAQAPLQVMSELVTESLTGQAFTGGKIIPGKVGKGAAMGAAMGAPFEGIGAIPGGVIGARAGFAEGMGETSFAMEKAGAIIDAFQQQGIDVTNYGEMRKAFGDQKLMSEIRDRATRKAVPIAAFDTVSALIGGRIFRKPATTVLGKIAHGAAETGVQALMGMAGEATGEFTSGDKFSAPNILAEGLGEIGPGAVEIAVGSLPEPSGHTSTVTTNAWGDAPVQVAAPQVGLGAEAAPMAEDPLAQPLGQPEPTYEPPAPEEAVAAPSAPPAPPSEDELATLARDYSFPRGLLEYVDRADFDEIVNGQRTTTYSPTQQVMLRAAKRARIAQLAPLGFTAEQAAAMSDRQAFAIQQQAAQQQAPVQTIIPADQDGGGIDAEAAPLMTEPVLEEANVPFSVGESNAEQVGQTWQTIAGDPTSQRFGDASTSTDMATLLRDLGGGQAATIQVDPLIDSNGQQYGVFFTDSQGGRMYVDTSGPDIYVNSYDTQADGTLLYQTIYAWAHNNGRRVIGDPDGVSPVASLRRISHMLSSALRFDTTRHLLPNAPTDINLSPDDRRTLNNLRAHWRMDESPEATRHNIRLLAQAESEMVLARLPALREYSFRNGFFYRGDTRIPAPFRDPTLAQGIASVDPDFTAGAGTRTLARALVSAAAEKPGTPLAERLLRASAPSLRSIRYSVGEAESGALTAGAAREAVGKLFGGQVPGNVVAYEHPGQTNASGGLVQGFALNGRTYLNAANLRDATHAQAVFLEEAWHHVQDDPELAAARSRFEATLTPEQLDSMRRLGYRSDELAPEAVARELQKVFASDQQRSLWQRMVDAFRGAMRRVFGKPLTIDDARTLIKAALRGGTQGATDLSFSIEPQTQAEAIANDEGKRRKFIDSVKANTAVEPTVRERIESIYQPITNADTLEAARARINEVGIDRALAEILATSPQNPPTALTNTMGIELMSRLQQAGRFDEESALAEHIASQATSQGQAIQALSMMSKMSPEGINLYAQRQIQQAVRTSTNPEVQKLYTEIQRLKTELATARRNHGTKAIMDIADAIRAAGLPPEKQVELQQRLRDAVIMSATMPGDALARITSVLRQAGIDHGPARKMAQQALDSFRKAQMKAREKLLRQMLSAKNLLPAEERMSESIVQRIDRVLVQNPGSLWGRYREGAMRELAAKLIDAPQSQGVPALQEFTQRLVRQLQAQIPESALGNRPDFNPQRPEAAYIGEAIRNFDKYADVWKAAQDFIRDKYRNDDFILEQLDDYLGQALDRPFSQASLLKAMRETTSKLDMAIRDILLRSDADKRVARDQIAAVIVREAGLSGPEAEKLRDAIWEEFNRQVDAAREAYAKGLFRDPVAKVPKSQLQRWLELNNAGLLDDEQFHAGIAKKYGIPVFTRETAANIQSLQRAYEAAPVGDHKLVAGARMMQAVHELIPVDFWTKVRAARNMAMLLNPKTIIRNVGGNVALWIAEVPADTVAWGIDGATSLVTGARTRTGLQIASRLQGLAAPIRDYRSGVDYARQQGVAHGLWRHGIDHMLMLARLTNQGVFHEGKINERFRSTFSSRVMNGLESGLTLLLGVGDRAFHQSAYLGSLQNQMDLEETRTGAKPLAPTQTMVETALLDANAAIFQDENVVSKMLGAAQKTLNLNSWGKDEKRFGLGTVVVPFTQVPGSIAARAFGTWSPVGVVRAIYEARHLLFNRGQFNQRAFTNLLSRGTLGSGLGYLGFYLFKLGIISALSEDDPDREAMRKAAGLGQFRVNTSELKRRMLSGDWHTPATQSEAAQEGDVIVNYDWLQPIAVPVAAGAQLGAQDAGRARALAAGKSVSELSRIQQAAAAGFSTLEAQPLVSSIARFTSTAGRRATTTNPEGGLADALYQAATQELASGFVPTVLRQIGQLGDNTMRETRATPLAGIAADLPGFSDKFPARYDVLGEMQERYQYGSNTIWNVLVNPAFVARVKSNPVLRELDSLYERTGENGVLLRQAARTATVNGKSMELTNEQRSEYQHFVGKVGTSLVTQLISSPGYANLPDPAKARLMSNVLSATAAAGKIMLLGDKPKAPDQLTGVAFQRAQQLGWTLRQ